MKSLSFFCHRAVWFVAITLFMVSVGSFGQTTVGTGSIVGLVTDSQGAVVIGAKIVIKNKATGQELNLTTNSSGSYSSGPVPSGDYQVQISSKGFSTVSSTTTVQVGNTATASAKLQIGQESQIIEVQGSAIAVNLEQAEVQGVLTAAQIENLPVNGRNFLDLAQLEPGVQIQDGQNFDPTKAGYSSISFGGRFGRTARIYVDGVDISDETVGTATEDIPASAIDEFQLSQSSLDLSNDLTSSGAVNVTTKSGTNSLHGEAFYYGRDHTFSANATGGVDEPFQRHQFGGSVGGALLKDRLFFFLDGERTKQDSLAGVNLAGSPFKSFGGSFTQPFRENNTLARADYNFKNGGRAFYRNSYFSDALAATFGLGFSVYSTKNITRQNAFGVDFNTGTFSHSIRFSYLKFQNQIVDKVKGSSLPLANLGILISSGNFFAGPNLLAPQSTPQSNHQIKYDGSKGFHSHTLRYGFSFNHVQGGGFADFYGAAPRASFSVRTGSNFANNDCGPNTPCVPSCGPVGVPCFPSLDGIPADGFTNPLNYPLQRLRVGNGQGFNTLSPALGFPAGGLGPDNRFGLYVGDSWKIKPNFTLSGGVRFGRDTGRTDSDLAAIPEINAQFAGAGNAVKQPNSNLAPQIGFAWDPRSNGKTVIRGGIGLYYENVIWNNVLFDRPLRLRTGAFNAVTSACLGGVPQPVPVNTSTDPTGFITPDATLCGAGNVGDTPIGQEIPAILAFWNKVLAGNPLDLKAPNPNFVGNFLAAGQGSGGNTGIFGPNYKTGRSVQMNIGFQREIKPGTVFSADFVRNVGTHSLLSIDLNHDGSIKNFNLAGAQQAISDTLAACGATSIQDAISGHNCAALDGSTGGNPNPATISDFANFGLSNAADQGGTGCQVALGHPCAFGGKNASQAGFFELLPIGRSVYNALQMKLSQNVKAPMRGVKAMNLQVSYSLSRFSNSGGAQATGTPADNDQDFVLTAADMDHPGRYTGPSALDRTHQISFGGFADLPHGFKLSLISHFYSPLAIGTTAPTSGNPGEIFLSDFTGDGTVGDPLPGTKFGEFGRKTHASTINNLINHYNTAVAGQATPAGQVLITNNLVTLAQLQALGGVAQAIALAPPGQVDFPWLKATDLKIGWKHTFFERVTIEPNVGFYNLFNFANFNLPPSTMSGILSGPLAGGSINGTDKAGRESFRIGNGTGVYSLGAQRQIEFGMRITF